MTAQRPSYVVWHTARRHICGFGLESLEKQTRTYISCRDHPRMQSQDAQTVKVRNELQDSVWDEHTDVLERRLFNCSRLGSGSTRTFVACFGQSWRSTLQSDASATRATGMKLDGRSDSIPSHNVERMRAKVPVVPCMTTPRYDDLVDERLSLVREQRLRHRAVPLPPGTSPGSALLHRAVPLPPGASPGPAINRRNPQRHPKPANHLGRGSWKGNSTAHCITKQEWFQRMN